MGGLPLVMATSFGGALDVVESNDTPGLFFFVSSLCLGCGCGCGWECWVVDGVVELRLMREGTGDKGAKFVLLVGWLLCCLAGYHGGGVDCCSSMRGTCHVAWAF